MAHETIYGHMVTVLKNVFANFHSYNKSIILVPLCPSFNRQANSQSSPQFGSK